MKIFIEDEKKVISFGLFNFKIDKSWLDGVEYKYNSEESYRCSNHEYKGKIVQIVSILQINPKIRTDGSPIFKDGENDEGRSLTAKERVLSILSGYDTGEKIRPVILYRQENTDECVNLFEMYAGCHRLHCSILYGYKKIPAIIYDKKDLIVD
jgi:hypothetical protein